MIKQLSVFVGKQAGKPYGCDESVDGSTYQYPGGVFV